MRLQRDPSHTGSVRHVHRQSAGHARIEAAWPIIVLFVSVIGAVLYLRSCRPRHIGSIWNDAGAEDASRTHREFVAEKWKQVVGSDIHCVAGDGLGSVTAMIVMRLLGFGFWPEIWTEYVVGFAFGWLLFQAPAMHHMGMPWMTAIWKGGRAEFFSMVTVMLGMGFGAHPLE